MIEIWRASEPRCTTLVKGYQGHVQEPAYLHAPNVFTPPPFGPLPFLRGLRYK